MDDAFFDGQCKAEDKDCTTVVSFPPNTHDGQAEHTTTKSTRSVGVVSSSASSAPLNLHSPILATTTQQQQPQFKSRLSKMRHASSAFASSVPLPGLAIASSNEETEHLPPPLKKPKTEVATSESRHNDVSHHRQEPSTSKSPKEVPSSSDAKKPQDLAKRKGGTVATSATCSDLKAFMDRLRGSSSSVPAPSTSTQTATSGGTTAVAGEAEALPSWMRR